MNNRKKYAVTLILTALVTLLFYIIIHESGHAIVMLSVGVTITEFSIINAYVSGIGGNYTDLSDLWLNANGALLPLLLSYINAIIYKKEKANLFYKFFTFMFTVGSAMSVSVWVVIPFLFMAGKAPANEDATKFVYNFSQTASPVFVTLGALVLIGISVFLLLKKGILRGFVEETKCAKETQ